MKVAILGCGLMGGSLAAALKRRSLARRLVGYDRDPQVCERARQLGLVDECASSPAQAVQGVQLVVLATPVGSMSDLLAQMAAHLESSAVVTDLGSTKADVVAAARGALGPAFRRFIGTHPVAGAERGGPERADPELFAGCTVAVTPVAETDAAALARIEQLWLGCGAARIARMDPVEHDRLLAAVSHLPHLLAFALMSQIAADPEAQRKLALAGPGFRDFTRIAAGSPAMWTDIALANRDAIGRELAALIALLQRLERALAGADAAWLSELIERASRARRRIDGDRDER